jgi:hypothetical protein
VYWDAARRTTLRDYAWNFAQIRVVLGEVVLPDVYAGEWAHAYLYPVNCLRLHAVRPSGGGKSCPYVIVRSEDGSRIILCDEPHAVADCTRDIKEASAWDDDFAQALSYRLAALVIAPLLKSDASRVNELNKLYGDALPAAVAANANERRTRSPEDSWLAMRGGMRYDA